MIIIKNKAGNYLPKNNEDVPIFRHCFDGRYEVNAQEFYKNEFLLTIHGYNYELECET